MRESIIGFAEKHLKPYTLRGDELIPDYCPICHGGDNRDRYTYALNGRHLRLQARLLRRERTV